jgi:aldehyde dehydrogenase (NAD+)
MAPAIARGNSVVMIPSQKYPLSAMDFYQVLDTSDVPGGVVNIVTGDRDHLVKTLVQHEDVDSVWYFGSAEGSYHVENESAANMKRTWTGYGLPRDWLDREQGEGHEFQEYHLETKGRCILGPTCTRRLRSRISGCRRGSEKEMYTEFSRYADAGDKISD